MTERRRRPHPAIGARWVSVGLAVSATVGITSYLEIDNYLHPPVVVAVTPSPVAGPVAAAAGPVAAAVPSPAPRVPRAPQVTIRTVPTNPPPTYAPPVYVPPVSVPPTHAQTRGSNG